MFNNVFKNKKILITGHTGFKGSWLSIWLHQLGAEVFGISKGLVSDPSNFSAAEVHKFIHDIRLDITDYEQTKAQIEAIEPDFVFHLAAQALVRTSYENPIETITSNAIGSVNILEALRVINKSVTVLMITSDKVYDNVEWLWGYREIDRIGGKDPYSASKGMAELAIRSYYESYLKQDSSNIRIAITRAGNVIGGGDWAKDRIVPDCAFSWSKGKIVKIRSPRATRPWQHVLEPLSGYLTLAMKLKDNIKFHGQAYNFGPSSDQNFPVSHLIEEMKKHWKKVNWEDVSNNDMVHEASLLKLNCDKALENLNWKSVLSFEKTVEMTINWYKEFYENMNEEVLDVNVRQIEEYTNIAKLKGLEWASD